MLIKSSQLHEQDRLANEITPQDVFKRRRAVLKGLGASGLTFGAIAPSRVFSQATQPSLSLIHI